MTSTLFSPSKYLTVNLNHLTLNPNISYKPKYHQNIKIIHNIKIYYINMNNRNR